jgi:hypothetical protein
MVLGTSVAWEGWREPQLTDHMKLGTRVLLFAVGAGVGNTVVGDGDPERCPGRYDR